jgi:Fe-S-cluster containining protein
VSFRLDPEQRFSCAQCGRCCRRWDVLITDAERETYVRRGAARWFRETDAGSEGTDRDPFEPVAGWRGYHRIRARADGACGFLSAENRCRLHEQLGETSKPLTCRMFPFKFHPVHASVVVTASFGCPTIVENRGELVSGDAMRRSLEDTWQDHDRPITGAANRRQFVAGRSIDAPSIRILRESLLRMLAQADVPSTSLGASGTIDLRANVHRIAQVIDDLTRSRVLRLADADFAEYIKLTLPYAADSASRASPELPSKGLAPPKLPSGGGRIGRLMQFGFLYVVAATRYAIDHRGDTRWSLRIGRLRLLAHFHRLAPPVDRVNVRVLRRQRVDVNAPAIQPVAYHYLRASIEGLGARERPVLDDFAIAVSCLNAACALAVMNAHASGGAIDREIFSDALMESVDVLHADDRGLLGWALPRLAAGVEALKVLSAPTREVGS